MKKAIILLLILLAPAYAEQGSTLAVTLDEPAPLQHETLAKTKEAEKKKEVPIGWVGVTKWLATITTYPGKGGRALCTIEKDSYLAILGEYGSYYGVLMSDNSTGWIAKEHVNLLAYQVMGKPNEFGNQIINTAMQYLGIRYKWGGYSTSGIDCSGFVKAVFATYKINLPRTAREQAQVGAAVPFDRLQPGDRLYFNCKGGAVDHAGIYMGNGYFIHSSTTRGGVAIDKLETPLFKRSLVTARR
ncbi:MAG: C40 family peptidase [Armatimonadota bacterium]